MRASRFLGGLVFVAGIAYLLFTREVLGAVLLMVVGGAGLISMERKA